MPVEFSDRLLERDRQQLLRDHLTGVSRLTRRYAEKLGIGEAGGTIGLLHDLGKYSSAFQRYLRRAALDESVDDTERGKIDHSTAGAQTIWRGLKAKSIQEGIAGEILAVCIASHHSGLIDCITPGGSDNLSRRMNKADEDSHFTEAWASADQEIVEAHERNLQDRDLVPDLVKIMRRICEVDANHLIQSFKVGLLVRFLFSCLIDADRTDTADFSNTKAAAMRQHGCYATWPELAARLELRLGSFAASTSIEKLRRRVSDACLFAAARPRGMYLLTVPTGGGKTLASLRFALNHASKWRMDRVIYVSPYTSIIDQNADVVRKILEPSGTDFGSVVLEHHSNLTPLKQTWRSKVLSENWDAPVVFTTAVQLLESLFGSGTRAVRRMHQMANAILIFDEVQTLPVRCVHLFNNALNFMTEQCGSTVVLCTATQPLLHQVDPNKGAMRLGDNAEIMRDVTGLFAEIKRYETFDRRKPGGWAHVEAAQLAVAEMRRAGSCLVIVNTKREALSIFSECRSGSALYHLSTSMCPAHRLSILEEIKACLRDGRPVIGVSTQLMEAGVDISFGSVIRALAGLDSVAQAAGRCNRHGEIEMGQVHLINLAGEVPKTLPDIRMAQEAAQRVLDENPSAGVGGTVDLGDPKMIESYFRYYFFDRREEMDYRVGPEHAGRNDTLLNMLAKNSLAVERCVPRPPIFLRQAFARAGDAFEPIDANTRGIVVPYGPEGKAVIGELCGAYELEGQFKLLKRAQQFTVNVFSHELEGLKRDHAVHEAQEGTGVLYLDGRWYSNEYGLNFEGTEEMSLEYA